MRREGCVGSWWGNRREGNHWGYLGVDGWIILGWIFRTWVVGIWTGMAWPRIDRWRKLVTEGRRPLGRPRCRWMDNIKMDLQEVGCGHMDRIGLAQDRDRWRRIVSAEMNLRVT